MVMQLLHQLPEGASQSAELCFAHLACLLVLALTLALTLALWHVCLHSSVKSVASCTH